MRKISPDVWIAELREWVGTPWHHQGRAKGAGADCIGLVIGAAHALKLTTFDIFTYPAVPHDRVLETELRKTPLVREIPEAEIQPGDLEIYTLYRLPQHVAVRTQLPDGRAGMLHAYVSEGRVVETGLTDKWAGRRVSAFRPVFL